MLHWSSDARIPSPQSLTDQQLVPSFLSVCSQEQGADGVFRTPRWLKPWKSSTRVVANGPVTLSLAPFQPTSINPPYHIGAVPCLFSACWPRTSGNPHASCHSLREHFWWHRCNLDVWEHVDNFSRDNHALWALGPALSSWEKMQGMFS